MARRRNRRYIKSRRRKGSAIKKHISSICIDANGWLYDNMSPSGGLVGDNWYHD